MGLFDRFKAHFKRKSNPPYTSAVIVAAGDSLRMGLEGESKQLMKIGSTPVIAYTLKAFETASSIDEVVVVARTEDILPLSEVVREYGLKKVTKIVVGGKTRTESVQCGIAELNEEARYVAIQDGARPFVRPEKIDLAVSSAIESGAAALGVLVKDTIKAADENGFIVRTVNRDGLYQIQTPQVFELERFRSSLALCISSGKNLTDDCQVFELAGIKVKIVPGDYDNIKLTYPEDLSIAEGIAEGLANE